MGCENSVVTPGISSKVSSIFSINSSLESADVHSSLSFRRIIMSPASIGIGSVGISAEPILVTIILISGNRFWIISFFFGFFFLFGKRHSPKRKKITKKTIPRNQNDCYQNWFG